MSSFSTSKADSYFKGKLLSQLNESITKKIANDKISLLEINAHLMDLSEYCNEKINVYFGKYGLELQEFSIISINTPQDDPSVIKLKEAKDYAARLEIAGREGYQMERSFDVLQSVANNQSGSGQLVGLGAGLGVGAGVGYQMNTMAQTMINTNPITPPPIPPQQQTFFVLINGQQFGGQTLQSIQQMIMKGLVNQDTLIWTQGMANWMPLSQVPALSPLLMTPPPVPQVQH